MPSLRTCLRERFGEKVVEFGVRHPAPAKVFMDGRSDFYGQDLLETYAQLVEVKPGWDAVLKRYDVRFVLVPPDHALASVLQLSSDWKRVYADSVADVFERVG